MSAILAPSPPELEPLVWLAPSPLWEDPDAGIDRPGFERPWLAELDTDEFVPAFLDLMSGSDPAGPAGLGALAPADGAGTGDDPMVLYRPIHRRYYVVVGSLVCRRVGLPDREVLPRGQRVSFVVRRVPAGGGEEAWLPAAGAWVSAPDPASLVEGEEQHPMHAVPVGAASATGPVAHLLGLDEPGRRQVHFGYVPVAGPAARPQPLADPLAALAADPDREVADDARLLEFRLRVAGPWADIGVKEKLGVDIHEPSLYLLLDLRDWLSTYLPDVLDALVAGAGLPAGSAAEVLRLKLDIDVLVNNAPRNLGVVLGELAGYAPLVSGAAIGRPTDQYDVHNPPGGLPAYVDELGGTGEADGGLVLDALVDPNAPGEPQRVPPELAGSIVAHPEDPAADADRHVLRLVYEHEPCAPVVSKPSAVVRFAGVYDPDAPARPIRIELPDPTNLRRFPRGVAMDMPPALRRTLDRVTPDILKDKAPGPEGGWQLGMICSFSLQIIMLVAFIVMFIFLILLNIVFWWLPFLKICFPVPLKRSSP
jgi:hypothetical protein